MKTEVHAKEEEARTEARAAVQEALTKDENLSVFIYKLRTGESADENGVLRGEYVYTAAPRALSSEDVARATGYGVADTVGHIRTRNDEMKED